jgi:hypothetical protein
MLSPAEQTMNVTSCYRLTERLVEPARLKLDPNNPRLSLGWGAARIYTPSQLRSDDLQGQIYAAVLKAKHRVKELVQSIAGKGFMRGSQPMIVKPIGGSSDLLVLEGNRRSAAIRHLMARSNELKPGILESIKKIPVQVFEYVEGSPYSEDEVVDVLLGTIHIEGPQEWGAMEKSYYVYRSYQRERERKHRTKKFLFDKDIAKALAENYGQSANKIKTILGIYPGQSHLRV